MVPQILIFSRTHKLCSQSAYDGSCASVLEKPSAPPASFSFTAHTEHLTSDTSGHQMCGFSPDKRFCDTSWVSYDPLNSIVTLSVYPERASHPTG